MGLKSLPNDDEIVADDGGLSVEEIIAFAQGTILEFFADKQYYCGGPIPEHMLRTSKRVNLVLDCTFDMAMDIVDEAMTCEMTEEIKDDIAAGGASPEVRQVIDILEELAHSGVPQELSNGMLILYLELCLGVDVSY